MKRFIPVVLFTASLASGFSAEREISGYTVKERGPHHRIWERIEYEDAPDGTKVPKVRSYTELATGLHYKDEQTGQWLESREEIEILPNAAGAAASKGQHKVIFPANILGNPIELQLPDKKWLRSQVLGLAYFDRATGKSVLIAELKSSVGEVHRPNVVIYPDCFDGDGFTASLRYTYTRAGFEQDVVLATRPPGPDQYGLNPETSTLQVLTEFLNAPQPRKEKGALMSLRGELVSDESLHFSAMMIGRGKAFAHDRQSDEIPVAKEWFRQDGRDFLIEEVLLPDVQGELQRLPELENAAMKRKSGSARRTASVRRELPSRRLASAEKSEMKLAMSSAPLAGLVLDYITINNTLTNYTFAGDQCYYVSGPTYLYTSGGASTIVEGSTSVKYASGVGAKLVFYDPVEFRTDFYSPAIFTAKDDRTVGQSYDFGNGNPSGNYAETALVFNYPGTVALKHVRISYAQTAVSFLQNYPHTIRHIQIRNGETGLSAGAGVALDVGNALFADVRKPFSGGNASSIAAAHVTANRSSSLVADVSAGGASFAFTNSLFAHATNLMGSAVASLQGANNAFLNTTNFGVNATTLTSSPFQQALHGYHYLSSSSGLRNTGSTSLQSDLAADLRRLTTVAPVVYTNVTFSTATTFSPQAQRDTDQPDCGYHYYPMDYVFGGCTAGSNMTFTAGTAVGWFSTSSGWQHAGHGIRIADLQTMRFDGTASAYNYLVRYTICQESKDGAYGGYGPGGITSWAASLAIAPEVHAKFLRASMFAQEPFNHFRDDWGPLKGRFSNSEFHTGGIGAYISSYYYTNTLFNRCWAGGIENGWAGNEIIARNCTWIGGYISVKPTVTMQISIRDCAIDGATIITNTSTASNGDFNFNAYTNASNPFPIGGGNDVQSVSFNWQTGYYTTGRFYLPYNSPLIDAGGVNANQVGLYNFTTQSWGSPKETNSVVDIGYHYVATTEYSSQPMDSDGDGIPDYLEDRNGNGIIDNDETDWNNALDMGLRVWITRPRSSSVVP